MDVIYSLRRKHIVSNKSLSDFDCLHEGKSLCSVSIKNVVAFSTRTELEDTSGKTYGSHVYVSDLNTPWHCHKVMSSGGGVVTAIEWDPAGEKIAVATATGRITIWGSREQHVLNVWHCLGQADLPGESIIAAAFFHNGRKISILTDKKDSLVYTERMGQQGKFSASVRGFGGGGLEGVVAVTSTGVICAVLLPRDSPYPLTYTQAVGNATYSTSLTYVPSHGRSSVHHSGSTLSNSSSSSLQGISHLSHSSHHYSSSHSYQGHFSSHFSPPKLPMALESLASTRETLATADISYGKNGQFVVAVSNGEPSRVQLYRVSIKYLEERLHVTSQAFPSFFLQSFKNELRHSGIGGGRVVGLKFALREDADSLVVGANRAGSTGGGVVELWQLSEKPMTLHRAFSSSSTNASGVTSSNSSGPTGGGGGGGPPSTNGSGGGGPGSTPPTPSSVHDPPPPPPLAPPPPPPQQQFKTVVWQHECTYTTPSPLSALTTCKLALTTSVPQPSYVMVATNDATVHCLYRDSLKLVGSCSVANAWLEDTVKHQRLNTRVTCMDITWLGCAFIVVDSQGQLYVFKVPPVLDPGVGMSVNVAAALLEYCLVTGADSWDILISLRPSILDTVADRLAENFNRQPLHVQQFYYVAHLAQRTALSRLTQIGQSKAVDLTSLLMLHSIMTAFTSLLRPSDMTCHDKGPTESLTSLMNDNILDIDKVLIHLEPKELTVEPSTLQSLQQLIQWTADLALNLLARLPEQHKPPSCDLLLRDYKALNSLRQLLVIVRVWGLLRSSCLPLFVRSAENLDVLALLFKLLSKLVVSTHEPDEALIDECCLLPSQVMIPQMNPSTPMICIASPALHYQSFPIQLEFNVEPECLLYEPEVITVEGALRTDQSVDIIRHIYLGKDPILVKECVRCGGKSQVQNPSRTAAVRAWDQRWIRTCRCGGLWRLSKATTYH